MADGVVWRSIDPECRLVGDFLWPAQPRGRLGGADLVVGEHSADHDQFLACLLDRWFAFHPVFSMGQLRRSTELLCLETQPLMRLKHIIVNGFPICATRFASFKVIL